MFFSANIQMTRQIEALTGEAKVLEVIEPVVEPTVEEPESPIEDLPTVHQAKQVEVE